MFYITQDPEQTAFMFKNGRIIGIVTITGRIRKEAKEIWVAKGADSVTVVGSVTLRKTLIVNQYSLEGKRVKLNCRYTLPMAPEKTEPKVQDANLAVQHLKTQSELSRLIFVYKDGSTMISDGPLDVRKRHIREKIPHTGCYLVPVGYLHYLLCQNA